MIAISLTDLLKKVELIMNTQLIQKVSSENEGQNIIADREKDLRVLATQGSREAREFIKCRISFALTNLKELVNQENIDSLIEQYQINYFKNIYTGNDKHNLARIDDEIKEYFSKFSISYSDSFDVKLDKLCQILYQEIYGYSIIDELIFESSLNEVACNRYNYIWIQYKGVKRKIPNKSFMFSSKRQYEIILENRITSTARKEMNNGEPIIYSVLENGSRVTALRPPLSRYFIVSIRLFNDLLIEDKKEFNWTKNTSLNNLTEVRFEFGDKIFDFLDIMIKKARRNIAIIGEQGSGKTTVADKIIIRSMDEDLSIGVAENIHELDISRKYVNKNIIELQYGESFTPSDLMEMFFRLNRDVVIFGEVRNHFEAFEMLKAMLRQARGSLFTFHSSSVKRMIHDLRQLLIQTGFYKDFKEAQFDVADAVDIIIHVKLDKKTGERYIYKVCELIAVEETLSYKINELFVFDREKSIYQINRNGLDKSTIEDCLTYELVPSDISLLKEIFTIKPNELSKYEYLISSTEGDLLNVYEN